VSGRSRLRSGAKVTTTVSSPSVTAEVISRIVWAMRGWPRSFKALSENATSRAVSFELSWKRASGRSRKR
jgi:hypothetical protein